MSTSKEVVMPELEFEQKYILDPRREEDILRAIHQPNSKIIVIRQFYEDGGRYRCYNDGTDLICTRENKRGLKLNTPYSVSLEEEPERISLDKFNDKWATSKRRLTKVRHQFPGMLNQQVMVDLFYEPACDFGIYAAVAEVEAMLTEDTKILYLDLELPIYLRDFLLKTIDARDSSAKVFKSTNMTEDNIEVVQRALEELYEHKPL
jgi:hypothetical protein